MERESEGGRESLLLKGRYSVRACQCCEGGCSPERLHPPTRGLRVREREKERQMKNDTKCEREKFTIHCIPRRGLYNTSNVTVT